MRFVVTGASGQLGAYLLRHLARQSDKVVAWSHSRTGDLFGFPLQPIDLTDKNKVATAFRAAKPNVVIHAAALSSIIQCFRNPEAARQVNVDGTTLLAELANQAKARLLLVSTDLVFDGERGWYREHDIAMPQTVYGQSKVAAERAVLAYRGNSVARVSLLFGPTLIGRPTHFDKLTAALRAQRLCALFEDEWRTPLGLIAATQGLVAVARSDFDGLLHMGGPERMSRLEMGQRLATVLSCGPSVLVPTTRLNSAVSEPRPRDTSFDSTQWCQYFLGQPRPTFEEALKEMIIDE